MTGFERAFQAVAACEAVDKCLGRLAASVEKLSGNLVRIFLYSSSWSTTFTHIANTIPSACLLVLGFVVLLMLVGDGRPRKL